jgi:hypothetical protein
MIVRVLAACLLGLTQLSAQTPYLSMPRRGVNEQQEFVKQFLSQRMPIMMEWKGEVIPALNDFGPVVAIHPWAQLAVVAEIDRLLALPGAHEELLTHLGFALSAASSPFAFDAVRTRLKSHPKYQWMMSALINHHLETVTSYPFAVVYEALLSNDPYLSQVGRNVVRYSFIDRPAGPPNQRVINGWARALRQRYKGEPTDQQLLTDPIAAIIQKEAPSKASSLLPLVKSMARTATDEMGRQ